VSQTLSTLWRVQSASELVECVVIDAPGGPQLALRSSPDETILLESPSYAREMMAKSQRLRDELMAQGWWDAS
jgi:hypothetical protein